MNIGEMVDEVEATGVTFRLDGEKVRVWYPDEKRREELAGQVAFLRDHRAEVATFLKARSTVPPMPPGVCLIQWNLKQPPVCLEIYSVVTDPATFAKSTLRQIHVLLENPRAKVGWTIAQLIDRLAQVGVIVTLGEPASSEASEKHVRSDGADVSPDV